MSSKLLLSFGCLVVTLSLSSCRSIDSAQRGISPAKEGHPPLRYSIVCIIHGDGDYLYHDSKGNQRSADEVALARVQRVAENNPSAEVFIFHEKPKSRFLFVFPLHDGEFYYYRNGHLAANESYLRGQGRSRFDPETAIYQRFRSDDRTQSARFFFYFGHEIPAFGGVGYDASYPDQAFTVQDVAGGLKSMAGRSKRFDLVVLSSCFNGTPSTVAALSPFAKLIIASPDNLHLSYFDLRPFERLDVALQDGNVAAFAKQFARHAFDRLAKNVQTAVSVAVYDVDCVQPFLQSADSVDRALTLLNGEAVTSLAAADRCDCAELPAYVLPMMSEGVEIFYRPARFGRSKDKQSHSGWECWRKKPQRTDMLPATQRSSSSIR